MAASVDPTSTADASNANEIPPPVAPRPRPRPLAPEPKTQQDSNFMCNRARARNVERGERFERFDEDSTYEDADLAAYNDTESGTLPSTQHNTTSEFYKVSSLQHHAADTDVASDTSQITTRIHRYVRRVLNNVCQTPAIPLAVGVVVILLAMLVIAVVVAVKLNTNVDMGKSLVGNRNRSTSRPTSSSISSSKHNSAELQETDTLAILVDDIGDLYIDSQLIVSKFGYVLQNVQNVTFSSTAKCIAVRALNRIPLSIGLIMQTSTGIVSDRTWKCTSQVQYGTSWTLPDFDDALWPNAVEMHTNKAMRLFVEHNPKFPPNRLWIGVADSTSPMMFCRKTIIKH